jgi:hypothetical protein
MIITLYGTDSYLRNKKKNELINSYKLKNSNIDIVFFDLDKNKDNWLDVENFLKQPSMFINKKLAVVNNGTIVDLKGWCDLLKKYINNKNIYILINQTKKPPKKFKFLLEEPVIFKEFKELEGNSLLNFLNKESKKRKILFDNNSKRFLLSFINDNKKNKAWLLINELNKIELANFSNPIKKEDLEKIIYWNKNSDIFNITKNIIYSKDQTMKLSYLESLFLEKEDSAHIFNLLGYQSRGKNSLVLSNYDFSIKSGGLDYKEAILKFVLGK